MSVADRCRAAASRPRAQCRGSSDERPPGAAGSPLDQLLVGVVEHQPGDLVDDAVAHRGSRACARRRPTGPPLTSRTPGNSPTGTPSPSQLSRLTRPRMDSAGAIALGGLALLERLERLHRHRHRPPAGLAEHAGSYGPPVVEVQRAPHLLEVVGLLLVRRRDDVALLVLGDRQQPVHLVHARRRSCRPRPGSTRRASPVQGDAPHVGAHRGQPAQHR